MYYLLCLYLSLKVSRSQKKAYTASGPSLSLPSPPHLSFSPLFQTINPPPSPPARPIQPIPAPSPLPSPPPSPPSPVLPKINTPAPGPKTFWLCADWCSSCERPDSTSGGEVDTTAASRGCGDEGGRAEETPACDGTGEAAAAIFPPSEHVRTPPPKERNSRNTEYFKTAPTTSSSPAGDSKTVPPSPELEAEAEADAKLATVEKNDRQIRGAASLLFVLAGVTGRDEAGQPNTDPIEKEEEEGLLCQAFEASADCGEDNELLYLTLEDFDEVAAGLTEDFDGWAGLDSARSPPPKYSAAEEARTTGVATTPTAKASSEMLLDLTARLSDEGATGEFEAFDRLATAVSREVGDDAEWPVDAALEDDDKVPAAWLSVLLRSEDALPEDEPPNDVTEKKVPEDATGEAVTPALTDKGKAEESSTVHSMSPTASEECGTPEGIMTAETADGGIHSDATATAAVGTDGVKAGPADIATALPSGTDKTLAMPSEAITTTGSSDTLLLENMAYSMMAVAAGFVVGDSDWPSVGLASDGVIGPAAWASILSVNGNASQEYGTPDVIWVETVAQEGAASEAVAGSPVEGGKTLEVEIVTATTTGDTAPVTPLPDNSIAEWKDTLFAENMAYTMLGGRACSAMGDSSRPVELATVNFFKPATWAPPTSSVRGNATLDYTSSDVVMTDELTEADARSEATGVTPMEGEEEEKVNGDATLGNGSCDVVMADEVDEGGARPEATGVAPMQEEDDKKVTRFSFSLATATATALPTPPEPTTGFSDGAAARDITTFNLLSVAKALVFGGAKWRTNADPMDGDLQAMEVSPVSPLSRETVTAPESMVAVGNIVAPFFWLNSSDVVMGETVPLVTTNSSALTLCSGLASVAAGGETAPAAMVVGGSEPWSGVYQTEREKRNYRHIAAAAMATTVSPTSGAGGGADGAGEWSGIDALTEGLSLLRVDDCFNLDHRREQEEYQLYTSDIMAATKKIRRSELLDHALATALNALDLNRSPDGWNGRHLRESEQSASQKLLLEAMVMKVDKVRLERHAPAAALLSCALAEMMNNLSIDVPDAPPEDDRFARHLSAEKALVRAISAAEAALAEDQEQDQERRRKKADRRAYLIKMKRRQTLRARVGAPSRRKNKRTKQCRVAWLRRLNRAGGEEPPFGSVGRSSSRV